VKQKILLVLVFLLITTPSFVNAQDETVPVSLEVKLYTDGSALISYKLESDPSEVRTEVELFGENYNKLTVKNEEDLPLSSTITLSGLTIDTLGASELAIIYSTSDLTTKIGPIWDFNLTSPIMVKITLPEGAAIFDLGNIPIEIGTVNGVQYLQMPPGDVYVSFLLSIPDIMGEAEAAMIDAETKISQARNEGRTQGLEQAEEVLESAKDYYDQSLYNEARTTAKEASQLASSASQPSSGNNIIYLGAAIAVLGSAGAYYYLNYMRKKDFEQGSKTLRPESTVINLDKLFNKHDDLRLDDREVIKFIAENNGEAFATEIRDRFDMPRSTAWRLIRRLTNLEIIEEKKIGNQSLIRIKEVYHE
jgi:uncharacterized membrane protein